jgi:hypothetical protein
MGEHPEREKGWLFMKNMSDVETYMSQIDSRLRSLERTDHIVKTAYNVSVAKEDPNPLPKFENWDQAYQQCREMDLRLQGIENFRSSPNIQNKIQWQFELIEQMANTMSQVMQKLNMFDLDDRFLEIYTDDEIKKYYILSGLTQTEVKTFIDKVLGKDTPQPTISLWVNGRTDDLKLRGILGNYFKGEALKKTKGNIKAR